MGFWLFALAAGVEADLSWLAGYWLSCEGGVEVSETWSDLRGGQLLGVGISSGNGKVSWEQTRIGQSQSGYSFFAQPSGQPAAEFPLLRYDEQEVVFENLEHDFPQRVIYRRFGNQLIGRIEGVRGGLTSFAEWRYQSAPLNARCPAGTSASSD